MIEVVPARPSHIGTIANRMRAIDVEECAVFDMTPKEALRHGIQTAALAWTVKINGRPEAMFGATTISLLGSSARVWLLMTDEAAKQRRALVRLGKIYTRALHLHYDRLENLVHAHNDKSIRWLARLGYAIGSVDVINGQPMRPFIRCVDRQQ